MAPAPRPAALSDAARTLLAAGVGVPEVPPGTSLQEARIRREAHYGANAPAALARTGTTARRIEIGGIPCCEVTGPDAPEDQAVVYFFGGGFVFGSPEQDMEIVAGLARATGRRVLAPYYRLAPEHPFPAGLEDCTAVLAEALEQFAGGVAVAGESAGGSLALGAVRRVLGQSAGAPAALALLSPVTDQGDYGDSALTNRDPVLSLERVNLVPTLYAPGHDLTDPEISAVFARFAAGYPPTLITTGTRDLFLSNCARLSRVMLDDGVEVHLRVWEGMWHAFEFYGHALPEARASLTEIGAFLAARLDR